MSRSASSDSPTLSIGFTPDGLSREHGGVKRYADELSRRFEDLGHSVEVTGRGLPSRPLPRRLRVAASHMREFVSPSRVDVIFCPFLDVPPRTSAGVPIVATIHDLTGLRYPRSSVAGRLSRRALHRAIETADHLICISATTQTDVIARGVEPHRTTVTPLGVDAAFFAAPATPHHATPGRPTLLYVGKRFGYKDFDLLIRALRSHKLQHNLVDLWIVGGEPLTERETTELTNAGAVATFQQFNNIADDELVALYHAADACVITSQYEGFGLPALEAMAAGCPLASSTGGSLAEVVQQRAFTFAPGDLDGCIAAILGALAADSNSPEVRSGRAFAETHSWERTAQQTLAVLEKVAADARN